MFMIIRVDQKAQEPLYLQIRSQIIGAIARGDLEPGQALPSVRSLGDDLGINLHTVNKAYAVLRDEGYILMRGRSGAHVADPRESGCVEAEREKMDGQLLELALAYRARGGSRDDFLQRAVAQADSAYGLPERIGCDGVAGLFSERTDR